MGLHMYPVLDFKVHFWKLVNQPDLCVVRLAITIQINVSWWSYYYVDS